MQERISELLKGTQFFDFGEVIFASNHPDHVYLVEIQDDENEKLITILYDKKHNFLNVSSRAADAEVPDMENIELNNEQVANIKQLLEASSNNAQ